MPNKKLKDSSFRGRGKESEAGISKPDMKIPNKQAPPGNAANSANPANPGNLNVLKKIKSSPGFKTDT